MNRLYRSGMMCHVKMDIFKRKEKKYRVIEMTIWEWRRHTLLINVFYITQIVSLPPVSSCGSGSGHIGQE